MLLGENYKETIGWKNIDIQGEIKQTAITNKQIQHFGKM